VTDRENALGRSLTSETPWRSARHVVSAARATARRLAVGSPTPAPDRLPGAGERRGNPQPASNPGRDPVPGTARADARGARPLRICVFACGGARSRPVSVGSPASAAAVGPLNLAFRGPRPVRARRVRAGRRYGARWSRSAHYTSRPSLREGLGGDDGPSVHAARSPFGGATRQRGREDLEGEQSPGRTCLLLPVSNPVRRAHGLVGGARPRSGLLARSSVHGPGNGGVLRSGGRPSAMCGGSSSNRRTRAHPVWRWRLSRSRGGWSAEPQGGNGRGDTARLPARDSSRGVNCVAGKAARSPANRLGLGSVARNAANPMIGSGMQQARAFRGRSSAEVVRNHEGGSCPGCGSPGTRAVATPRGTVVAARRLFGAGASDAGPVSEACRWRGDPDESQERRPGRLHLACGAPGQRWAEASKWRRRPRGRGRSGDRASRALSGEPRGPHRPRSGVCAARAVHAAPPGRRSVEEARGNAKNPHPGRSSGTMDGRIRFRLRSPGWLASRACPTGPEGHANHTEAGSWSCRPRGRRVANAPSSSSIL
jgi:hypothetical protein